MAHLIYYVAASLDGYIADEDGHVDWLPDPDGDEDFGYAGFYAAIDSLLMGRRTYDQVRGFGEWPYAGKPVGVWTRRPLDEAPELVRAVNGNPVDVVAGLSGRVWVVGGAEFAEALRAEALIDEWIVTLIPCTIGGGVPLFGGVEEGLEITAVEQFPGSILQLHMSKRDRK